MDILRGLTIVWITAFHFYVDTRGGPGDVSLTRLGDMLTAGAFADAANLVARLLAAAPSYRLDVLLFVTGLVLSVSRPRPPLVFWKDRARAVLPNYWMGTLAVAALLVVLAVVRAVLRDTGVATEIAGGTLLARGPYQFEWLDVPRSLSIVGRLESSRTMLVVAPSLWYVLLIMQLYLLFPALRWLQARVGSAAFLAICFGIMCVGRYIVLQGVHWPGMSGADTLIYFIPFRLIVPAAGMVAAAWARPDRLIPGPWRSLALLPIAFAGIVWSIGYGAEHGRHDVTGTTLPLLVGLPALWIVCASLLHMPDVKRLLTWIGRHSLSMLIVQDVLRLLTGETIALVSRLDAWTWIVMPFYVATAIALTPGWHALQERAAARFWPVRKTAVMPNVAA